MPGLLEFVRVCYDSEGSPLVIFDANATPHISSRVSMCGQNATVNLIVWTKVDTYTELKRSSYPVCKIYARIVCMVGAMAWDMCALPMELFCELRVHGLLSFDT